MRPISRLSVALGKTKKQFIINALIKVLCPTLAVFPGLVYAEIHGTLTGTTNYVWRMYSKSNNGPAIQGNLDYQHSSGLYLGASASNFNIGKTEKSGIAFPGQAQVEVTPYVGWSYKIADDWRTDLQYSRYFYDGLIFDREADYNEFYFFLHYKDMLSLQVSYIDDFYGLKDDAVIKDLGLGGDAFFYEITGRYPITDYLELSSGFGYARTKEAYEADYTYWNVGITGRYKFIAMDLRYNDAYEIEFPDSAPIDHPETLKASVVFSLSVGF